MNCLLREHLQRAVRNLVLLLRVLLRAVRLRLKRQNDLHVALRAERAALQERPPVLDAARVHVPPRVHVVERVRDHVERLVEVVVVELLGALVELGVKN